MRLPTNQTLTGDRRTMAFAVSVSGAWALVIGLSCYSIAGKSLDLLLGCVLLATLITPSLSAFAGQSPGGLGVVLSITIVIAAVWFILVKAEVISIQQWLMCGVVLLSWLLVLACVTEALTSIGINSVIAPALVLLLSLGWLTWPVWLSPSLAGNQLRWSILFQPLFAINHIVDNLGIWTEQQEAYKLTTLGQDVQYQMPSSAFPVIVLQFGIAGTAGATSFVCSRMAPRSTNQIDSDASKISDR